MALFCMILGIVIFVLFLFGGYVLASMLLLDSLLNVLNGFEQLQLSDIFRLPSAQDAGTYLACMLIMGFIGLMIGLGFYVNGMVYKKMDSVERISRRAIRRLSQTDE